MRKASVPYRALVCGGDVCGRVWCGEVKCVVLWCYGVMVLWCDVSYGVGMCDGVCGEVGWGGVLEYHVMWGAGLGVGCG